MKARVKATGEIVEINESHTEIFTDVHDNAFSIDEIDFDIVERKEPDYWEKLKHQYAGMAMQGILSNNELYSYICKHRNLETTIIEYATDLVNRLKEDSQCEK